MMGNKLFQVAVASILNIGLTACGTASAGNGPTASLTWFGQSTFVLTTSTGHKILLDPTGPGTGYTIAPVAGADLVTVSHEHSDHNNVGLAAGSPLILRGLRGGDWARIDQTVGEVRVRAVPTYHDDTQGSERGKNAAFVFELDGLRLAHLGDLGHALSPEQVKAFGTIDVLLIPTGGFFTIDGRAAAEMVLQLNPRIVVPMHYETPDLSQSLAERLTPVETFTAAMAGTATITEAGQTIVLDSGKWPTGQVVMVMKYK